MKGKRNTVKRFIKDKEKLGKVKEEKKLIYNRKEKNRWDLNQKGEKERKIERKQNSWKSNNIFEQLYNSIYLILLLASGVRISKLSSLGTCERKRDAIECTTLANRTFPDVEGKITKVTNDWTRDLTLLNEV